MSTTGLGLEPGGKDPGCVMQDADLDAAVDTLIDGNHDMRVMREESFGPVVGIMQVSDVNSRPVSSS